MYKHQDTESKQEKEERKKKKEEKKQTNFKNPNDLTLLKIITKEPHPKQQKPIF